MSRESAEDAIVGLNKRFGAGSAYFLGDYQGESQPCISTGLYALDSAMGGGFARGKIAEVYGPEGSGKTTLTLHCAYQVISKGGIVGFVDAEHALNIDLVNHMKIDTSQLILSQPDCGEDALDVGIDLIESNAVELLIFDSVAAMIPRRELEGEMSDQQMGEMARMLGKGIRKIRGIASKKDIAVIFINQLRMKIGVMFGNPEVTPGGKALAFAATQRLDTRAYKHIKSGKVTIGREGKITVVKNKIAPPFRSIQTELFYGKGFDVGFDLFDYGSEMGVIEKSGNTYSCGSYKLGIGKKAAVAAIRVSSKVRKRIRVRLKKALGT